MTLDKNKITYFEIQVIFVKYPTLFIEGYDPRYKFFQSPFFTLSPPPFIGFFAE